VSANDRFRWGHGLPMRSKQHKAKAEALALDPQIIKGEDYRKFLKDNEQATKKLMGW
jgi:putative tricarboxylic transport membrane protein